MALWHRVHPIEASLQISRCQLLTIAIPHQSGKIGYAATLSAGLVSLYFDRAHFRGATLWFADDPFDGWEQSAGRVVIDRIRAGFGDLRPFSFNLVHHFQREEIDLLTAFMILGTVLAWDYYVLSPSGDRIVFVSYDELFWDICKQRRPRKKLPTCLATRS